MAKPTKVQQHDLNIRKETIRRHACMTPAMEKLETLLIECEQRWEDAHKILIKASTTPSEPIPLLTGTEMKKLFSFTHCYQEIMQTIGLEPRGAMIGSSELKWPISDSEKTGT